MVLKRNTSQDVTNELPRTLSICSVLLDAKMLQLLPIWLNKYSGRDGWYFKFTRNRATSNTLIVTQAGLFQEKTSANTREAQPPQKHLELSSSLKSVKLWWYPVNLGDLPMLAGYANQYSAQIQTFYYLLLSINAILHVIFAGGVARDAGAMNKLGQRPALVSATTWAFATLIGGIITAAIYWFIHHSTLTRPVNGSIALQK